MFDPCPELGRATWSWAYAQKESPDHSVVVAVRRAETCNTLRSLSIKRREMPAAHFKFLAHRDPFSEMA
jgi:hypothetical protein